MMTTPARMKARGKPKTPNAMMIGGIEISLKYNTRTAARDNAERTASVIAVREMTVKVIDEALTAINDTALLMQPP